MKIFRFLAAALCALASVVMFIILVMSLTGYSIINPEITDSFLDKIFWILTAGGCAIVYAIASIAFAGRVNLPTNKPLTVSGLVAMFMFLAGLYYTVMFQSPW